MAASQDTEITLGTGKLLGLFFGLVILCAVFFGLGYSLGRNTGKPATVTDLLAAPVVTRSGNGAKPPAVRGSAADCVGSPEGCPPADSAGQSELSFYKSVGQKQPDATLQKPSETPPQDDAKAAPEMNKGAAAGYVVQIAAVSKQEDAEALVSALRKKQYPVFTSSGANDKLFHVQIGPFADLKEAESTKQRLMGDGYNPIVKK